MKGLDNEQYLWLLIASNIIAMLQLLAAIRWPRIARLSFFLLFAWASWINWTTSQQTPEVYQEYANLTWSSWYRDFINGWFASHTQWAVGFVASCQGLIALAMLAKGWLFRLGAAGAILFLLAILPLGTGSGFPATALMATGLFILFRKHAGYFIWQSRKPVSYFKTTAQ